MSPAPTPSEIMRRLDDVVTELHRLADTLDAGFVRKDVLAAQTNAIEVQISGLEDEVRQVNKRLDKGADDRAADRRLIVTSLIAPIVVGVVLVLILSGIGIHR